MTGIKVTVFRPLGHHIARAHIAAAVPLPDLIKSLPRTKVAPAHPQRHYGRQVCLLHHSVIYGICGGGKKGFLVRATKGHILFTPLPGIFAGKVHFGRKAFKLIQIYRSAQQEHAAVPEVPALGQHGGGGIRIGFFHKTGHAVATGSERFPLLYIAKSGFRPCGGYAKGDNMALFRKGSGACYPLKKHCLIADGVVRGQNKHQGVGITFQQGKSGQRNGRGRVAGCWFKQNFSVDAAFVQLGGHIKTVRLVADNYGLHAVWHAARPLHGILEQCSSVTQIDKLLGIRLARKRPQTGSTAATQNNRSYVRHGGVLITLHQN